MAKRLLQLSVLVVGVLAISVTSASGGSALRRSTLAVPTVKVLVNKNGWYRVPKATLDALGFVPTNTAFLHLTTGGADVAFEYNAGALEFYGQSLDTQWTDTRTYWFSQGTTPGLGFTPTSATTAPGTPSGTFAATTNLTDRGIYLRSILNGSAGNFYGALFGPGFSASRNLVASHVDTTQTATLQVTAFGFSTSAHTINVSVNGTPLAGSISGSGVAPMSQSFTVPAGVLQSAPSPNTVTLSSTTSGDLSMLDTFVLTYRHFYNADSDVLDFSPPGGAPVSVDGFSTNQIRLIDITNPQVPRELLPTISGAGSNFTMSAAAPAGTPHLYAFENSKALTAKAVLADDPSVLKTNHAQVDLIVITHKDFSSSVSPLVAQRTAEGLSVLKVDVQDVYDEFNFGNKDPGAIKDFLQYAYLNWQGQAPKYVLLVGDASWDPRDYLGLGQSDYVPTTYVDTRFEEAPSDDTLADFTGDAVPEMAVGRLPVRTASEATALVNKIVTYGQGATPTNATRTAVLVSDRPNSEGYPFWSFSDDLANTYTSDGVPSANLTKIYRAEAGGTPSDTDLHTQIVAAANNGPTVVNWFGHGNIDHWNANVFTSTDASGLTNSGKLSLYMMMTCLNGYFVQPNQPSVGEALLSAPGGAVAVWAAAGETFPYEGQTAADNRATHELLANVNLRIGDAMITAKASIAGIDVHYDVRRTWVLLGDPSMKLKGSSPTGVTLRRFSAARTTQGVAVRWRTAIEANVAGFNLYRFDASGRRTKVNHGLLRAAFPGSTGGAGYGLLDKRAVRHVSYTYRLEVVGLDGTRVWQGSARLKVK